MEFTAWLGLVTLVIGVPLNVVASLLLLRKFRQARHLRVLRERVIVAVITTLMVLVFGLIFVNNDQEVPPLADAATKLITRIVMGVMAIVPALSWILMYRRFGSKRP